MSPLRPKQMLATQSRVLLQMHVPRGVRLCFGACCTLLALRSKGKGKWEKKGSLPSAQIIALRALRAPFVALWSYSTVTIESAPIGIPNHSRTSDNVWFWTPDRSKPPSRPPDMPAQSRTREFVCDGPIWIEAADPVVSMGHRPQRIAGGEALKFLVRRVPSLSCSRKRKVVWLELSSTSSWNHTCANNHYMVTLLGEIR